MSAPKRKGRRRSSCARWTPREDRILLRGWRQLPPRALRAKLPGRSWCSIRHRAGKVLGLKGGAPQGYVSLQRAAVLLGYSDAGFVRRLAARHNVAIRLHPCPNEVRAKTCQRRCVEWDAIRDALTREMTSTESVAGAARARGISSVSLWRWLHDEGALPPLPKGAKHRGTAHVETSVIDRVVAARRPVGESIRATAERLGLDRRTLSTWLRKAGVHLGRGVRVGVPPEAVAQVIALRRATPAANRRAA